MCTGPGLSSSILQKDFVIAGSRSFDFVIVIELKAIFFNNFC